MDAEADNPGGPQPGSPDVDASSHDDERAPISREPQAAAAEPEPKAEPEPAPKAEPARLEVSVTPPPTEPMSERARLLALLSVHWPDVAIVAALLGLFGLVHRFVQVVEFGGDAVAKWQFVRQWWWGNDIAHGKWDHHTCRMGVNALTWVAQAIFGRGWKAYYVAPFFVASLQVPFVYLIGKRLVSRLAGVLSVLVITYLETVHRSASQLLPDGYAGTYAIIAAYIFLRFAAAPDAKKRPLLIGLSVVSFFGYLAKETFVFFYPGLAVAVFMVRPQLRDKVRDVALFAGILLGGLLLETGLYASFTNYSSRYAAIRATHGANGDWPTVNEVSGLFLKRFSQMTDTWKYLVFFSLASALWQLALYRHKAKQGWAIALIGLSHVFFLTFTVKSIDPIELWQSFDPRYMDPFTPFAGLLTGCLLAAVVERIWSSLPNGQMLDRYGPDSSPKFAAAWSIGFLSLFAVSTYREQTAEPPPDAFIMGARLARHANSTYDRNLPMLDRHRVKAKDLAVLYDVYMSDKRLAKDGKLPSFDEAKRVEGRLNVTYLVKDPSVYNTRVLQALMAAGCVVDVGRSRHGYVMTPASSLPAECDDVLAKAIR